MTNPFKPHDRTKPGTRLPPKPQPAPTNGVNACRALGGTCEWPTTCQERGSCAYGVATPFSDFIRNASPEEKAKVYGEVMDRVSEQQRAVISGVAPARRFTGVGELERTGYIPPGSADERERRTSGVLALADPRDLLPSALDDLRRAVAFQDQVREAAKNGEEVTGTGIARDAREWVDRAAREVVEAAHGVPAFDPTQTCALVAGGLAALQTMCQRCKNPHHKCDNGTPGVTAAPAPSEHARAALALVGYLRSQDAKQRDKAADDLVRHIDALERAALGVGACPACLTGNLHRFDHEGLPMVRCDNCKGEFSDDTHGVDEVPRG